MGNTEQAPDTQRAVRARCRAVPGTAVPSRPPHDAQPRPTPRTSSRRPRPRRTRPSTSSGPAPTSRPGCTASCANTFINGYRKRRREPRQATGGDFHDWHLPTDPLAPRPGRPRRRRWTGWPTRRSCGRCATCRKSSGWRSTWPTSRATPTRRSPRSWAPRSGTVMSGCTGVAAACATSSAPTPGPRPALTPRPADRACRGQPRWHPAPSTPAPSSLATTRWHWVCRPAFWHAGSTS